jgi:hypothetical protein
MGTRHGWLHWGNTLYSILLVTLMWPIFTGRLGQLGYVKLLQVAKAPNTHLYFKMYLALTFLLCRLRIILYVLCVKVHWPHICSFICRLERGPKTSFSDTVPPYICTHAHTHVQICAQADGQIKMSGQFYCIGKQNVASGRSFRTEHVVLYSQVGCNQHSEEAAFTVSIVY